MKITTRFFVAFSLLLLPITASAELVSSIVAIVNDDPITSNDVEKEETAAAKELAGKIPAGEAGKDKLREAALNSIINRKLIAQKIKELDIKVTDEEVTQAINDVKKQNNINQETLIAALSSQGISYAEYRVQLKEQLERLRLVSQEVRSKIQISDREMREYYAANPEKFEKDETYHARLIFFKVPENASTEEAKRIRGKAEAVLAEIKSDKDFAELAKKNSEDPSASEGGELGAFKRGDMQPEFESALLKLKPGEVSEIFATSSGLHIIKLESRTKGELQPFEKVKSDIEDLLYKKKSEERFNQWLSDLRKGAAIDMRR